MVKVLCLGWSDDVIGDTPTEQRGYSMAATLYEAATGEHLDWVMKPVVPSPDLPAIVEKWLAREQPDVVFLRVNPFFFNYTSVPIKLRARGGRVGDRFAGMALKLADNRVRSGHLWFKALRRGSRKLVGGATYFEPEAVVETYLDVLRHVARREGVEILVSGAHAARVTGEWMPRERAEQRLALVSTGVAEACRRIGAQYQHFPVPLAARELRPFIGFDSIHGNELFQVFHALLDVRLLLSSWRSRGHDGEPLIDVEALERPEPHVRDLLPLELSGQQWDLVLGLAGRAAISGPGVQEEGGDTSRDGTPASPAPSARTTA